jgi:hypothetical protein
MMLSDKVVDEVVDVVLAAVVEDVGAAFQEAYSEDVIFVGGGIEALLAQAVGSGVKMAFEFGEGEAWHGANVSVVEI